MKEIKKYEDNLHDFMVKILKEDLPINLYENFKDGVLLIKLYNYFFPEKSILINKPINVFKMRENLILFINGCKDLGVHESDLFVTEDLFEPRYRNVELCIIAFFNELNKLEKYNNIIPKELLVDDSIPQNIQIPIIKTQKSYIKKPVINKKPPTKNKYDNLCLGEIGSKFRPPKLDIHSNLNRQIQGDFHKYSGPNKTKTNNITSNVFYESGQSFKPPKLDIHANLSRQIQGDFHKYSGPNKEVTTKNELTVNKKAEDNSTVNKKAEDKENSI